MLDELLERILELTQGEPGNALAALEEIRQLVQAFTGDELLGLVRKVSARLTSSLFDDELCMLMDAAKADMKRLGIAPELADAAKDPLVRLAITTYCKAHFGLDNPDSEKYLASYQLITDELRKSGEYKGKG